MKKNLFRLLLSLSIFHLSVLISHAQRSGLPSIGSVYNFAAGDSFLYKLKDLNSGLTTMYVNWTILSRDDSHYPDSLIYKVEEIFLDTNGLNPAVWDTVRRVYRNCNDTIFPYNGFISCQGTDSCGTTSATIDTTDSFFPGLTVYHANIGCGWWNYGWNNAAVGLGIVHAYNACGDFVLQQFDILLVHYYKAITNVGSMEGDKAGFSIYPNPAKDYVTISVDESFIGCTAIITDITGRKMAAVPLITNHQSVITAGLDSGVYFVTLTNNTAIKAVKRLAVE